MENAWRRQIIMGRESIGKLWKLSENLILNYMQISKVVLESEVMNKF
jgi:hypothetical protein